MRPRQTGRTPAGLGVGAARLTASHRHHAEGVVHALLRRAPPFKPARGVHRLTVSTGVYRATIALQARISQNGGRGEARCNRLPLSPIANQYGTAFTAYSSVRFVQPCSSAAFATPLPPRAHTVGVAIAAARASPNALKSLIVVPRTSSRRRWRASSSSPTR